VFDSLAAYRPPVIDFLLPHGNWDARPPAGRADATTPYGDWLVAAFEHWSTRRGDAPRVRFFEEILFLLLGQASQTELVGLSPSGVLVIETDGAIEQVDALKSAYHRAADTGWTCATTTSTPASNTPAWWPGSWARERSATPAGRARCTGSAAGATSRTATGPAPGSATRRCTAPTCSASSRTSPPAWTPSGKSRAS
jgi:uncharacterized protein